ncbi:MAG: hydroxyacylglutathione hydrolase [Betaproteobacteria bacterium RIFCSPLOWO2_02_FULL_67_26]|nr:MAG: hydroxyacylglutathione hydrolase [Betaproteobacteria bacterium RIFCSPLOWO2_02_FULL_67_26]
MSAYEIIPLRAFADNYVWTLRDARCAAVVDPGDARPVLDYLQREKLELVAILNTHHHADHVGGNGGLLARWKVPVFGPHDDRIREVTHRLKDGSRCTLPHFGIEFEVFEIPGHTRTHIAFHGGGMLFCGDTLFAAGCGRLFEGTPRQMHDSLSRLMQLPDDTRVYCGHEYTLSNIRFARAADPGNAALRELEATAKRLRDRDLPTLPSTIGQEKATNPFVRVREPAVVASASRFAGKALSDPVSVLGAIREWKNGF